MLEHASEKWRCTLEAVNHVGVAIVSSAVTTAISTVPLLFCVIVPFAKFGQIVAINTTVSILFTLTVSVAMLACTAPIHFTRTTAAMLKATLAVMVAVALGAILYWVGGQLGLLAWHIDPTVGQFKLMSVRGAPLYTNVTAVSTRLPSKQGRWIWISK